MTPLMLFVLLLSSEPAWAECGDTGDTGWRMDDCDADGVTPAEGDCDDHNDNAYPGLEEQCDDFDDNNCDGFFNENCDDQRQRGTLMGGSICGSAGGSMSLLLPLFWFARRRRS